MWVVDPTVKLILGIIGNITAVGLFGSPCPTMLRVVREKTIGAFSPLPYLCTLLNCATWTLYGLPPVSGQTLVLTINAAGTVANAVYVFIFLLFAESGRRMRISLLLLGVTVFFLALTAVTFGALDTPSIRKTVVGIVADVITTAMYASPLSIMWTVVKTESVEYMPFFLSLNVFMNAATWSVYAIYIRDIYVGIPNVLGTILGTAQLVLYACYYKKDKNVIVTVSSRSSSRKRFLDSPEKISDEEKSIPSSEETMK